MKTEFSVIYLSEKESRMRAAEYIVDRVEGERGEGKAFCANEITDDALFSFKLSFFFINMLSLKSQLAQVVENRKYGRISKQNEQYEHAELASDSWNIETFSVS